MYIYIYIARERERERDRWIVALQAGAPYTCTVAYTYSLYLSVYL